MWLESMQHLVEQCSNCLIYDIFCAQMQVDSQKLCNLIPNWKPCVSKETLNATIVKQVIINNPKKKNIEPACAALASLVDDMKEAAEAIKWQPGLTVDERCSGAIALSIDAQKNTDQYFAIAAACNCVLNFKGSSEAASMAREILNEVHMLEDFILPESLETPLRSISDGSQPAVKPKPVAAPAPAVTAEVPLASSSSSSGGTLSTVAVAEVIAKKASSASSSTSKKTPKTSTAAAKPPKKK
jgi:hypothetical protein